VCFRGFGKSECGIASDGYPGQHLRRRRERFKRYRPIRFPTRSELRSQRVVGHGHHRGSISAHWRVDVLHPRNDRQHRWHDRVQRRQLAERGLRSLGEWDSNAVRLHCPGAWDEPADNRERDTPGLYGKHSQRYADSRIGDGCPCAGAGYALTAGYWAVRSTGDWPLETLIEKKAGACLTSGGVTHLISGTIGMPQV